jgi:2-dehydro-3-deoxyphosphogluconate aldolase/(4S)-4-hydroxy-2-oxoglutarate aldolase
MSLLHHKVQLTMPLVTSASESTLATMLRERVVAVLRFDSAAECRAAAEAMAVGGVTTLEITLTTPDAFAVIAELAARGGLVVGVGSVRSEKDLARAIDAGASFMASPVCDPAIVAAARERGVVAMPGALTPTEIDRAWRAGADLVKVFPMPRDATTYLRAILGPMPELRLAPSGGVSADTAREMLEAGAAALNVGTWMTHRGGTALHPSEIRGRAEQLVGAVRAATSAR